MLKLNLLFICLLAVAGCVTTTDITTHVQRTPLAKDAPVEVYHKEAPTFGYDLLCTASVQAKGNFVSTELSGYVEKAKEVARDCGAKIALIESLSGYTGSGTNVTVTIKAVEKTSQPSAVAKVMREDKEFIKKLGTAAGLDNVKSLGMILEKANISKTSKNRAPFDSDTLAAVMAAVANNGQNCAQKTLKFLATEYEASIDTFSGNRIQPESIMECPSPQVAKSFPHFKDKTKEVLAINRAVTQSINRSDTTAPAMVVYQTYLKMYGEIMIEVENSCKQDQTSELCSAKPNLTRAYEIIKKDLKIKST